MNQENKLQVFLTSPKGLTIMVVCVAVLLAVYLLLSTTTKNVGQTAQNITTTPAQGGEANKSTSAYPTTNPKLVTADLYFLKNPTANTVYINVKTKQPISGLQLVLAYNPSLLSNISITPGDFFDHPIILQNSADAAKGTIYYTLSINPKSAQIFGEGTVAILHYSGIPTGVSTTLSVLPQTKITSQGVNDSVLSKTSSITIP